MHALFVYNSNPGAVAPNHNAVRRGMARADLFTVVHDLFFNDTTDYADYVLPATTFLEHTDIQGAYGHYFVQLSQQAIEPPGEARSNVWLFGQLAQCMGFTETCFRDTEEQLIRAGAGGGARRTLEKRGDGAHQLGGSGGTGTHSAGISSRSRRTPFLPFASRNAANAFGEDRILFGDAGARRDRMRFRDFSLRSNRAGVKAPGVFRWSS